MNAKKLGMAAALLAGLGTSGAGQANFIQNGGFESFTGTFTVSDFVASNTATHGKWLDQNTWSSVSGSGLNQPVSGAAAAPSGYTGANWGRQFPGINANTTQTLMQGFDASALAAGTALRLEFDYITVGAQTASFKIYGLDAGERWEQFPPNPCFVTGDGSKTPACDLLSGSLPALMSNSQQWMHYDQTFTLPRNFQAIAIGFTFGSNTSATSGNPNYVGGLDEVSITAIPEPATLVLLGLGLAGLGFSRRRMH